jgi:phosphate transport system substrate-binding protein
MGGPGRIARRLALALVAGGCLGGAVSVPAGAGPEAAAPAAAPAALAPADIAGRGSSYVGPAMTQWTADAYTRGLEVNYLPTSSPDGLGQFQQSTVAFAGTEAEFSSLLGLGNDSQVRRGFQYVPDVAGAVAIMYNVTDRAGRKVDYLRLSRRTVALIFLGEIDNWSDPAITNDLGGQVVLPDEPITVVYRSGPSGTTALFYDFVQHMAPSEFDAWVARNRYPGGVRIIDPGVSPGFVPHGLGLGGSDLMAQHVSRTPWTITYDEFAYAKRYDVETAWIQNERGEWVQPFAGNISAALESARLRADLSQELSGVYRSRVPGAYPISAYSYLVTQCAPSGDRATCKGNYADTGVAETLDAWMRYIACEGQVQMADIGYSPLPPLLSQEMMRSVQRMWGRPIGQATQLHRGNCANPRFDPGYDPPAPPPPPALPDPPNDPGGGGAGNGGNGDDDDDGGGGGDGDPGTTDDTTATTTGDGDGDEETAIGRTGEADAVGGGSDDWRESDPVSHRRGTFGTMGPWPLLVVLVVLALPLVVGAINAYRRHRGEHLGPRGTDRLRGFVAGFRPPPQIVPIDDLVPIAPSELVADGLSRRPGARGARWAFDDGSTRAVCRTCIEGDRDRFRKLANDQPGGLLFGVVEGERCSLCRRELPEPTDLAELTAGGPAAGPGDEPGDPPGLPPIR